MYLRIPLGNYYEDKTDEKKRKKSVWFKDGNRKKTQLIKPFETKACFRLIVSKLQTQFFQAGSTVSCYLPTS